LYAGDGTTVGGNRISGSTDGSPAQLTQNLNLNSNNITGTGNIDINGFVTADFNGGLIGDVLGDIQGSVFANNSTLLVDALDGIIFAENVRGEFTGNVIGDIKGSVFGDDSILIIDSINNEIIISTLDSNTIFVNDSLNIGDSTSTLNTSFDTKSTRPTILNDFIELSSRGLLSLNRYSGGTLETPDVPTADSAIYTMANQVWDGTSYVTGSAMSFGLDGTTVTGISNHQFSLTMFNQDGTVTNSNGIHYKSNQKIGIMTSDPQETLDVNGNAIISGNLTAGAMLLSGSNIDTSDSSAITVTPATTFSSDVTVENNLIVTNTLTVDTLEVTNFQTAGGGTPELSSDTAILLTAGTRVEITQSPLKMASFTTTERTALTPQNGDVIYNTTDSKFQGYAGGAWVDLH